MIDDRSCVIIHGWMINQLHLSGAMLMIYATIYSFTNGTKDHCFHGSATYLGEWACISRQNVMKNLKKLEDIGLITRSERVINGVKFVDYSTATGCPKMRQDQSQNATSYNRDNNSISISKDIDNISSPGKNLMDLKENLAPQDEDISMPGPVFEFLQDSYKNFPSVKYQIDKQGSKYFMCNLKDLDKLKKEYGEETVYAVLKFIKQDPFWSKQIQTIGKLRKKNKDGIPYMVVMLEKMQQWKPKVLDLDSMVVGLS